MHTAQVHTIGERCLEWQQARTTACVVLPSPEAQPFRCSRHSPDSPDGRGNKEGVRMKEQQSGLGKGQQLPYDPRLQRRLLAAAARRQAQYEAIHEADPSYGGHFAGIHPEHRPYISTELSQSRTGRSTPTRAPVSFDAEDDYELEEDESYYNTRQPTSARRYPVSPEHIIQRGNKRYHVGVADIPQRASQVRPGKSRQAQLPPPRERYTEEVDVPPTARSQKRRWSIHPLLYLGVGMLAMYALFLLLSSAVSWFQVKQNDVIYGRPRTFQVDAVVGHNDSPTNPSHFIAINLYRHVEVIEIPGKDSSKMRVYTITTLFGDGQDLTPVTLSFSDLTGNGKLDMIIHIQNTDIAMINDNGTFRPAKPGEVKGLL